MNTDRTLAAEAQHWIDDMDDLRHAVGMATNVAPRNWGFRNHYNADADHPGMLRLERLGFIVRGRWNGDSVFFHVTEAGCRAIGLPVKARKRALDPNGSAAAE